MAQGDCVPARRLQLRIFREELDHRFIDTGDQLAVDRDAHQQRGDALRHRPHVVFGRRVEVELALGDTPGIVVARKILLEYQFAVADDDHRMNVGITVLQPCRDAAQPRTIETDAFGRCRGPAVVKRAWRSTWLAGLGQCVRSGRREEDRKAEAP
jgi:hypothetical protein